MHIDYEIREEDYLSAVWVSVKRSFGRKALWWRILVTIGLAAILFHVYESVKYGHLDGGLVFMVVICTLIVAPMGTWWRLKKRYREAVALHGRFSVDVDDDGWRATGPMGSSSVRWGLFGKYVETRKAVILFQQGQNAFYVIPKRDLTDSQLDEFRQILNRNITDRKIGNNDPHEPGTAIS
jgi:hypothetical protein